MCLSFFHRFIKNHYFIISICFLAFFLRFWGINFGLPDFHLFSDENEYVTASFSVFDENVVSPYVVL